jgi:CubicO group peptidase (beta-lactamase class C family)
MNPSRRRAFRNLAGLGGLLFANPGQSASVSVDPFIDSLPDRLRASQVPGLTYALIEGGELIRVGAWGYSDIASGRAMSPDSMLSTASVTKTFTCALVLQLCEQGYCRLDDPAEKYLPFPLGRTDGPPISISHLLTHTSGLADNLEAYLASYQCGDPLTPMKDWLRKAFAQNPPQLFPHKPGERHAYSNFGYGLLGLIAEQLTGQPFEALLQRRIFGPLGMRRSSTLLRGIAPTDLATPYEFVSDAQLVAPHVTRLTTGAPLRNSNDAGAHQALCTFSFATVSDGLIRSTADDLSRFVIAMINSHHRTSTPRLFKPETASLIERDYLAALPASAKPSRYVQGLTWRGLDNETWAHFGTDPGVAAGIAFRVSDGRGFAMLANSTRARPLLGRLVGEWMARKPA